MKIGPRIYLIVVVMLVASVVVYGIARQGMTEIRATYDTAFKERAPVTRIVDDFRSTSLDMKLQVWTLLVPDMSKDFIKQQIADMDTLKKHIKDLIADWDKNAAKAASPEERAKFDELKAATGPWFAAIDEYDAHMLGWLQTGSAAERDAAFKSNDSGAVDGSQKKVEELTAALMKIKDAQDRRVQGEASTEQSAALLRLMTVVGVTMLASVVLAVVIVSSITRPVRATVGFAEQVADGKLDAAVPAHASGEMGDLTRAIERMKESLVARMDTMREIAAMVEIAAEGVAATAQDVSETARTVGNEQLVAGAEKLSRQSENLRKALVGFKGENAAEADAA